MPYLSATLNVMTTAARKAGRALIRDFGELENLQVSMKGPGDFVSSADQRTERILISELSKARPGYGFLVEESGTIEGPDKSHRFIIDPLDGTTNFLHAIPHFAISIGLEREGIMQSAVVYNPVTDDMFTAERSHGAYLNDKRLRVAARKHLRESVFATGIPFIAKQGHERFLAELKSVMAEAAGVRRFGAASLDLAYVAAGRFDGYWERNLAAWDIAAGLLLVREASGVATDLDGGQKMLDRGEIIAANEPLHPQLMKLLKDSGGLPKS